MSVPGSQEIHENAQMSGKSAENNRGENNLGLEWGRPPQTDIT